MEMVVFKHLKSYEDQEGLIAGYLFSLLGGFAGILIGWSYAYATKTGLDGKRYWKYDKSSRRNGKNIMIIGIFLSLLYGDYLRRYYYL